MAGSTAMDPYLGAAHGWATGAQLVYRPRAAEQPELARAGARPAAELARVTRPGGALLASVYSTASRSAARDRVDVAANAASSQPGHAALPADRRAASRTELLRWRGESRRAALMPR
jgi:hypothetical protein